MTEAPKSRIGCRRRHRRHNKTRPATSRNSNDDEEKKMGNNISSSTASHIDNDANNNHDNDDPFFDENSETLGYRVLGVQPNSPASAAGLVSFLDFLIGFNGQLLMGSGEHLEEGQEYNDVDLPAFLMEHKDQPVEFLVLNIKSQKERLVYLTPSDTWGGAGLLGVMIRLDDYALAEERIIRVLSVDQQQPSSPHSSSSSSSSPAAVAGLVPERDYILGTTHVSLDKTDTLAALLQQHQDQVLELYVYNADSDLVRTVALMPTLSWGGRGLLGADVGMGYLHRLPFSVRSTDGASVERKLRHVLTSDAEATPVTTGIWAGATDASAQEEEKEQQEPAIFEHEPQLEMEPPEHEQQQEQQQEHHHHQEAPSIMDPFEYYEYGVDDDEEEEEEEEEHHSLSSNSKPVSTKEAEELYRQWRSRGPR